MHKNQSKKTKKIKLHKIKIFNNKEKKSYNKTFNRPKNSKNNIK